MLKGIDVSAYQSSSPSTSGYDFMFIKATEGRSYISPSQYSQAATARDAGLVVGFYHFLWPGNINDQAEYFVENCDSVEEDLLVCDWESTSSGPASCSEKDQFIKKVKELRPQHKVMLYCNTDFWWNRDTTSYAGDGLWIARYNNDPGNPGIQNEWVFHQYTDSPVDTNVGDFSSRSALKAWATEYQSGGGDDSDDGGDSTDDSTECNCCCHQNNNDSNGSGENTDDEPETTTYVVKSGDTLTSIAAEHGTTVDEIVALNPTLNDPDLIYVGEELIIPA